jgi:hypothetical protein
VAAISPALRILAQSRFLFAVATDDLTSPAVTNQAFDMKTRVRRTR